MATKRQIAEDLFKRNGALVGITDLARYLGSSKEKARTILIGLPPIGQGKGTRYFYEDVAEKILKA